MDKTLYHQLRNLPVYRSPCYLRWLKARYPYRELHHAIGSQGTQKLNDYLMLPVTREQHIEAEAHKADYCIDHLPEALNTLFQYVAELETKI